MEYWALRDYLVKMGGLPEDQTGTVSDVIHILHETLSFEEYDKLIGAVSHWILDYTGVDYDSRMDNEPNP